MDLSSSVRCTAALAGGLTVGAVLAQDEVLIIGREGNRCAEDAACFNRIHPDIPMAAWAEPGQTIVFKTRNAGDSILDPESSYQAVSYTHLTLPTKRIVAVAVSAV